MARRSAFEITFSMHEIGRRFKIGNLPSLAAVAATSGGTRTSFNPHGLKSKKSLDLAVNAWKTRSELAPKIGKGKYVLAEYEKIKRITMPFGDELLLYLTTEVEADHSNIYDRIRRLEAGLKY